MTGTPALPARGKVPQLVAHRGCPLDFPENSIAGIQAALTAGATAVEFDVNLSADLRPMVIHDAELQRTAGVAGDVRDLTAAELARIEVNDAARFGARFHGTHIPRLRDIDAIARAHPAVMFFVDVKRASLRRFGPDRVLEAMLAEIDFRSAQWAIVSFDRTLVEQSRKRCPVPVGWVVDTWDDVTGGALHALGPDFAFCAARNVPAAATLPAGHWQWVVYDVNDPQHALDLGARGADYIETDAIGVMLASPLLRPPTARA